MCTHPLADVAAWWGTGLTYQGLVSQIDVMPTILDLCQVPSPNRARLEMPQAHERSAQVSPIRPWPGVSLSPVLRGDSRALRSAVVIHNDDPWLGLKMRTDHFDRLKFLTIQARHLANFSTYKRIRVSCTTCGHARNGNRPAPTCCLNSSRGYPDAALVADAVLVA